MTKRAYRRTPGSPPRMRGKHSRRFVVITTSGITPADAGKTDSCNISYGAAWDHPRGCGENNRKTRVETAKRGSPPRMRGKPTDYHNRNRQVRITPADAGKTLSVTGQTISSRDHPRGCGENTVDAGNNVPSLGSPPRMRGKRSGFRVNDSCKRITPADAGKTKLHLSYFFTL